MMVYPHLGSDDLHFPRPARIIGNVKWLFVLKWESGMHGQCVHWVELACPIPSPDSQGLNKYALQFTQGDKR